MGLRRRVSFGFISIVGVLILSGLVSYYYLSTFSRDTNNILSTDSHYRKLSISMHEALRTQNVAFVQMTAFGDRTKDSLCVSSISRLDSLMLIARETSLVPEFVDSMIVTTASIRAITDQFMAAPKYDSKYDLLRTEFPMLDSLSKGFARRMYAEYLPVYDELLSEIDIFVAESQNSLAPSTDQLHHNAYRALTPVTISLIVMIAIVLMLYYFMMVYCVSPIIHINAALKSYLSFKVPYAPKGERRDEMAELNEGVEALIKVNKIIKE